ncbi:MAG TPA: hypothetical protein VHV51_24660 [Polyangiaceae bacterium]|jgi:hypothetical protein|nr:hypothetical protein [Polyangiaceae bacterium]
MSDAALEFAEEQGLGKVLGRVRLDGGLLLPNGARARATLLLTKSGLWLAAARDRFDGLKVDLLTRGDLRFEPGRVRDRLCFGREALFIPAGKRSAVERLIALARLSPQGSARALELKASRLVQSDDDLGKAWLERELAPGEALICFLRGSNQIALRSQLLGEVKVLPHLFVTERRAAIVAWSSVGDWAYTAVEPSALKQAARDGKLELRCGDAIFSSRRADTEAAHDAADLIALVQPQLRLLEAARRSWLARERNDVESSLNLLHAAIDRGSERARFARLFALAEEHEAGAPLDRAELGRALAGERLTPPELAELWARWQFTREAGSALVRALIDFGHTALPFALALQRKVHDAPSTDENVARDDLRLARFAVQVRLATGRSNADPRDRALHNVLSPRGLRHASELNPAQPKSAFSPRAIESSLCHPLARAQNSLVDSLQKLVAVAPEPDQVALSDYCEALSTSLEPAAARALTAARLAFALPTLQAYVSRGKKSIGLRGYEGEPPYLLLGRAHLDKASAYFMHESELFFAFGAEALHLKLELTRVTSSDVWAGALSHTKGGVELLLGLLPFVKGIPLGPGVSKVLERIPEPALRRGLDTLIHVERSFRKAPPENAPDSALSLVNENLLAAHRLVQMSADRAGLVLCGDLRAGLRGLLLSRPEYRALLDACSERSLIEVLVFGDDQARMRADLIVRVAALLDFYRSEDYVALRRALSGA